MTNRIALALGLLILGALVTDFAVYGGASSLFLAKKLADVIEYLAFWR
jgi:hypothetical protein